MSGKKPPVGTERHLLSAWREASEWWNGNPPLHIERWVDNQGIRREQITELPSLLPIGEQKSYAPDHKEEWALRERKIRDEKVSAACGNLPITYYERAAIEKPSTARVRQHLNRPDLRAEPVLDASQSADRRMDTAWSVIVDDVHRATGPKAPVSVPFAPLHVLSGYAFGRSTILAEEIAAYAAQCGYPAVGIADPFSLVGCVEFAKACRRNGLKPLIGASIEVPEGGELVLIALTKAGYRSLSQLITECHLHEPRGFPMATWDRLQKHSEGLLCLTGADTGPLNRWVVQDKPAEAERLLRRLIALYGPENTFVEIERSYLPWQLRVNRRLRELADYCRVTAVAGGAITHARPEHFPSQDILVCANTLCLVDEVLGRKPPRDVGQPQVRSWPARSLNAERFFRTPLEMLELFSDTGDLLDNTRKVWERVEEDVLPARTEVPTLYDDDPHALREIVLAEAHLRYPKLTRAILHRLQYELDRIVSLQFASHFLIAWDFCRWAREQDIQLSGRGSVVDSAVAFCLGFSRIDAIRHRLHFDRFLPEDGAKRPDIDIDFEARRRDDVRAYITRKYGFDRVATVAAVGAFCTRGIVREVGKALGLPNETIGFLAKHIHGGVPPDQIESALDRKPELRASGIPKERFRWVFRLADRLMDVPRNIRCHSSGVVVSNRPLCQTVPLMWSASGPVEPDESDSEQEAPDHLVIMQWDKRSAKHYFDKFDILCLRGQDVLGGTEERVRLQDIDFSVQKLPVDDPETYRAMRSGELIGIPQSASPAMRQAHVRIRTQNLDDASLVQAGIRPGVGGAVKINELIARRRGKPYSFLHPDLERILGNTYGIIVFQEQVDQLLQTFCGYTSGQAEDIRDAIHKRRREDFGSMIRDRLIDRMGELGHSRDVAEEVFELVRGFRGYGFAQGHALAFAEISIRSIYCQQNYPTEYFAALLSAQPAGYYGPCTLANEARTRGALVLPPDVNRSGLRFEVEDAYLDSPPICVPSGAIRVPLAQVAGLSKGLCERVFQEQQYAIPGEPEQAPMPLPGENEHRVALAERPAPYDLEFAKRQKQRAFQSVFDFAARMQPKMDELEALILCGAFDALHPNRRALLWAIPRILAYAQASRPRAGQAALPLDAPVPMLPHVVDFSPEEKAVYERSFLGLDVQKHLVAFDRPHIASREGLTTSEVRRLPPGTRAIVVGNPIRLRFPPTPSGKRVVFFDLEDESGLLNVTAFDAVYQRDGHAIVCHPYVTVIGHTQDRDGFTAFLADRVFPYSPRLLRHKQSALPIKSADFLVG